MDDIFSVILFIWIIYSILEGVVRKKQMPKLPSDQDQAQQDSENAIFEIPTLANDPNLQQLPVPSEEVIQVERGDSIAEIYQKRREMLRTASTHTEQPTINRDKQNSQQSEKSSLNLNLTPTDTMNAVILSEIFNKPKALRRR
ncbi:MAG: hypothetical protein IJ862_00340 [Selenomonadaceae bacterium]|nr:hypothetical protein [Selenomonadaceae bacterium]